MSVKILNSEQFYNRFEACEENAGEVRLVSGLAYNAPGFSLAHASNPHNLTSNVGRLRQDMVICIMLHNNYKWVPLHKLSKANKIKFMGKINDAFRNQCISQNLDVDMGAGTYIQMQQECQMLELKMRQTREEIKKIEEMHKKKTCVIDGCPGMNTGDFDHFNPEGFEECFCCKQKQELDCPICYDTHSVSNMVCGKNCTHHICWKCYGMSCQGGNQIKKCQMCRKNFNSVVSY
jgi:hypothetical protein